MKMQLRILVAAAVVAAVAACGSTPPASDQVDSPVTRAEAVAMAETMLAAYNDRDYAAWSGDWSQAMKNGIPEEAFLAFRDQTMETAGRFTSIDGVELRPGQNSGVVRWEFATAFENGPYTFMIAFREGGKLIEGVNLAPAA